MFNKKNYNYDEVVRSLGMDMRVFITLPTDCQEMIAQKYYDEVYPTEEKKSNHKVIEKIKMLYRK